MLFPFPLKTFLTPKRCFESIHSTWIRREKDKKRLIWNVHWFIVFIAVLIVKRKHTSRRKRGWNWKLKIDRKSTVALVEFGSLRPELVVHFPPFFFPSVHDGISFLFPLSFRRCSSHPLLTCSPVISIVLPPSFFPNFFPFSFSFSLFFSSSLLLFSCTCPVLQVYNRSCSLFAVISKLCKSPCAIESSSPFSSFLFQSINNCSHSLTHLLKSLRWQVSRRQLMLQSFFFLFLQIEIAYPMFLLMLQIFFVSVFFCFFSHFHKISYFSLLMIPSLVVFSSSLYLSTSICVDFTLKKYNLKDHCPLPPLLQSPTLLSHLLWKILHPQPFPS